MNVAMIIITIGCVLVLVVVAMLYVSMKRQNVALVEEKQQLANENSSLNFDLQKERQARSTAETFNEHLTQNCEKLQQEKERLQEERLKLSKDFASLEASSTSQIRTLREQLEEDRLKVSEEREKQEETFRMQFKNLANEILGEQSQQFKKTNKEEIDTLLKPFRDNISEFRKRFEDIHASETEKHGELKAELKNLMDLNQKITAETTNLTNALKGNSKVQGDWGETSLATILDNSSLTRGIHYETQYNVKDAEGHNLRPDVVVNLPEGKHIIIDSKVSLTAYVNYSSAESEAERQAAMKAHLASVRQHVKELSAKEYQTLMKSPDFVVMFIPTEPAFLEAMKNDPTLWSDAYEKKIIISSPTNLFALLKMVADMWKYNDQEKNTKVIAQLATKVYEQAVRLTDSFEEVGSALGKAQKSYDDLHKRLCTGNDNFVRLGERLRKTARLQSKQHFSKAVLDADDNTLDFSEEESNGIAEGKSESEA